MKYSDYILKFRGKTDPATGKYYTKDGIVAAGASREQVEAWVNWTQAKVLAHVEQVIKDGGILVDLSDGELITMWDTEHPPTYVIMTPMGPKEIPLGDVTVGVIKLADFLAAIEGLLVKYRG